MKEPRSGRATVNRRQFLRLGVCSAGALALMGAEVPAVIAGSSESTGNPDAVAAVLIDVSRCVGCQNCQRACSAANNLHPTEAELSKLSDQSYTFVDRRVLSSGQTRTVKRQCMHCLEPACVAACTVGALKRNAQGAVVADTAKCIGCRYCQYACPYGVPQFEWENTLGVIRKCTSCVGRLEAGQPLACAAACPSGALRFGQRGELLAAAHARLKALPDNYVNYVYGEQEVGGAARLYIADVPFDQLGLPKLGATPAPHYAEQVMSRTPTIAIGVAALCTGLYSFLGRRRNGQAAPAIEAEEEPK